MPAPQLGAARAASPDVRTAIAVVADDPRPRCLAACPHRSSGPPMPHRRTFAQRLPSWLTILARVVLQYARTAARGRPCPIAGRSLRPSRPPLSACRLRSGIHACACRQARLPGHGRPLADTNSQANAAQRSPLRRVCRHPHQRHHRSAITAALSPRRQPTAPHGCVALRQRAEPAKKKWQDAMFFVKPFATLHASDREVAKTKWPGGPCLSCIQCRK